MRRETSTGSGGCQGEDRNPGGILRGRWEDEYDQAAMRLPIGDARAGVRTIAIAIIGLGCAVSVWAADPPSERPDPRAAGLTPAERVERLLDRVKLEQASMTTLAARFVQHKESLALVAPDEATGRFFFQAPDRVRWEYLEPHPMKIVVRDDEMLTWFVDLGTAERLAIGRLSDQIFKYLGASNSLEMLQRYFDVNVAFPEDRAEPYRLDLTPRFERVARRLVGMTIWIHPDLFLPNGLRYEEPDGDVTEYRFESLEVGGELPEGWFDLELPDGVEVRTVELGRSR